MATLFQKAAAVAPKKSTKASEKLVIPVNLGDKISELLSARTEIKNLEAAIAPLESDIIDEGKKQFVKLYNQFGKKPESFVMQSGGANCMIITQDKYLKVTPEKEQALTAYNKSFAENVIEKKTVFKFNPDILNKYEKVISDAISKIKGMTDEEKMALIQAEEQVTIKKGTIETLGSRKDIDSIIELIQPVFQIKNA